MSSIEFKIKRAKNTILELGGLTFSTHTMPIYHTSGYDELVELAEIAKKLLDLLKENGIEVK